MAIQAQKTQSAERELAPKGRHQAVLIGIKDEGLKENTFKEGNPLEPKLSLVFEIGELNEKGEPHSFYFWKTNSAFFSVKTGKMSGLIEMLTQWLDVTAGELSPSLLDDLELLCGLNARVRLTHKPKQDGNLKCEMTSIEPWEEGDAPLLTPSREWGESGFFPAKSRAQFWAEVKSGVPCAENPPKALPAPKPRPEPRTAPLEPEAGEEPVSLAIQGQIRSLARHKLPDDGPALQELCRERFGKKFAFLSADEGGQLMDVLRRMKDTALPDGAEDVDPFDDEPELVTPPSQASPPTGALATHTDAQAAAIAAIAARAFGRADRDADLLALTQKLFGVTPDDLDRAQASEIIDALNALLAAQADPFANEDGEATEEEARAMLMPKDEPKAAPARKTARAASEAYGAV